jgi:signal transduction histidine kinase
MSAIDLGTAVDDGRSAHPRSATALAGGALLGSMALALGGAPAVVAVVVAGLGAAAGLWLLAPHAVRALNRHRGLIVVLVLVALAGVWVQAGLHRATVLVHPPFPFAGSDQFNPPYPFAYRGYGVFLDRQSGWPWRIGHTALLPLALTLLAALGGLVLLADAVRIQLGLSPRRRVPWRMLAAPLERRRQIGWRAGPAVALIVVALTLAIGLANRYVAGDVTLEALMLLAIGGGAAVLIASPLVVGWLMRLDRDKAGTAREEERQRFAAHLHDSVLQTLALVQRQAHDPAAVMRLARRQEQALRAWMAGESELVSDTLTAALRDVVAEVEDECAITIELTAIGDRPLDAAGEALVAAAREALRNAGRHAPGAAVFAFGEINATRVELFIRDDGPGFQPDAVAAERRGIRDAVIGRMAMVGGRAVIESVPGEGTEVALLLGET